jgi:hypothetical protein
VHARGQLLGLAGCGVFMGYAAFVLAGEPAHEAAHPYDVAPYSFVKRGVGAIACLSAIPTENKRAMPPGTALLDAMA